MIRKKDGFTLFELLIAVFVGTILIVSGAYAIRMGLFSMEKEEVWFNDLTKERTAFDFFWQQVSSLQVQRISPEEMSLMGKNNKTKKTVYFAGEKDFLTFVSPLSLRKNYGQGLVIAYYKVISNDTGKWDLLYDETRVNPSVLVKLSEEPKSKLSESKNYTIFLKDYDMISFSYLDTVEEETDDGENVRTTIKDVDLIEGTDLTWKEKISEKIPQAIKLVGSKHGKEQELISTIMVTYSFLASGQL